MPRKRGFKKAKDKFDSLSSEFKDAVAGMSTDEIRKRISEVAILDCTMKAQLKLDEEVNDAKAKLKNLMEPYREDFKSFKLQIEYSKSMLDAKGGGATVTIKSGTNGTGTTANAAS